MHNLLVAELADTHEKGNYQSVRELVIAAAQQHTEKVGLKNGDFDISIIDEGFGLLVDQGVAEPWQGGVFDAEVIIDLYQSEAGLPDLDSEVLIAFLDITEIMDFSDPHDVQSKVSDFTSQYGIGANDGTFIGLVLDTFINSHEYWQSSDKVQLEEGTPILGDALVGGLFWMMFGPVGGYIAGAAWSYIYVVSQPADDGGCVVWNDGHPY